MVILYYTGNLRCVDFGHSARNALVNGKAI